MNRIGFLLTVLLLVFMISGVSAQSHVTTPGSFCRYAKNSPRGKNINREGHTQCPACDLEDEKEDIARKAENKRREDVKNAAIAAENLAKQRALEAELKRKRDADKGVTEVAVTMSASKGNTTAAAAGSTAGNRLPGYFYDEGDSDNQSVGSMTFPVDFPERNNRIYKLYSDINYFVLNNQRILDNDEFRVCVGVKSASYFPQGNPNKFPPGVGIVVLNKTADDHVISDLVDANGKRLLNDDNISTILHFSDDYFILLDGAVFIPGSYPPASYQFKNCRFYNYKTKQFYQVPLQTRGGRKYVEIGWTVGGTYLDKKKLRDKSTYRAFVEILNDRENTTIYYITNEGKLESDDIHR
ncbi:hypothetical protein MKQ70_13500 [Chitinophaga sedimenti]|uniref:hypothetical protein n=1 Tax=Chitinophaga sedimenti TaxID=2033606 RepID=UPI002003CA0C|nr:hypothetical protein [Chitinophaga sedimenti]MCK7555981.1 hypothetical protein [Chitinophaga sedimenti]